MVALLSSPFPTHTSILTNEALEQQVLARYDLPQPIHCAFFRQGLNDTYVVAAESFYLRVYRHNWRTQSQIEAEIAVLNECVQAGLPVAAPVAQRDGRFLTTIAAAEGTRYGVLFTAIPGQKSLPPHLIRLRQQPTPPKSR